MNRRGFLRCLGGLAATSLIDSVSGGVGGLMPVVSGADPSETSSDRANRIIDDMVDGPLSEYRALRVWDEHARRTAEDPLLFRLTYRPFNTSFPLEVFDQHNNRVSPLNVTSYGSEGTFSISTDDGNKDFFATYEFNYFPSELLLQFLQLSMAELNASADTSAYVTNYTLESAPDYFDGPLAVGTLAKAFRKLSTDTMLWKNFLIWPNGDVAQQVAAATAQEYLAMFMELRLGAKRGKFIARPSQAYEAFRNTGFGGINAFTGKWRGLEVNKIGVGVPMSGNP